MFWLDLMMGLCGGGGIGSIGRTPAQIGNCIFWGSAYDVSAVGDGNAITTWADKGGAGNTLTPTTGDYIYRATSGPDSQPAIDCSAGSSATMTFASEKTNLRTVVAIMKLDNYGGGSNPPALGVGHSSVYHWHSNASNDNYTDGVNTATEVNSGAWRHDGGSTFTPSSTVFTTAYKIISVVTTGNTSVDNFGSDRGGGFFRGHIVEWALFSTALSNTELNDLHDYFGDYYNISVSPVS